MDEGIPFVLTPADQVTADYIRWTLRKRKASPAEFRRRCEECKRLAMDATPMTEGEREQLERELQGSGDELLQAPSWGLRQKHPHAHDL